MKYRLLGSTGINVSAIAFGAGPVSGLMTGSAADAQHAVIHKAIKVGINWFDTAATYGNGQSEASLGACLSEISVAHPLHIATKVRVNLTNETDLRPLVVSSVRGSLDRLKTGRVSLLQLHNSITRNRNDHPTSITVDDVLSPQGILEGMNEARDQGLVDHFGLTGIGDADALRTVLQSKQFATIQAPFHLLNPSTLRATPAVLCDPDYGGFLQTAHEVNMGIFAIRAFAAGAVLNAEPSAHTLKTPFFPVDLYQRDRERARRLAKELEAGESLGELALRYCLSQPEITSTIVGFGAPEHVVEADRVADLKLLSSADLERLESLRNAVLDQ